jgi:hypothetical protein
MTYPVEVHIDGIPVMQTGADEWGLPDDCETPHGLDFYIRRKPIDAHGPFFVDLFTAADRDPETAYVDTLAAETLEEAVRSAWHYDPAAGEKESDGD